MFINQIDERHKKNCKNSKGHIIDTTLKSDFNMKYESMSIRESTIKYFGNQGIGWHGCAVVFINMKTYSATKVL